MSLGVGAYADNGVRWGRSFVARDSSVKTRLDSLLLTIATPDGERRQTSAVLSSDSNFFGADAVLEPPGDDVVGMIVDIEGLPSEAHWRSLPF